MRLFWVVEVDLRTADDPEYQSSVAECKASDPGECYSRSLEKGQVSRLTPAVADDMFIRNSLTGSYEDLGPAKVMEGYMQDYKMHIDGDLVEGDLSLNVISPGYRKSLCDRCQGVRVPGKPGCSSCEASLSRMVSDTSHRASDNGECHCRCR